MLSIFVMYSNDRLEQLKLSISCWEEMIGYEDCQKTLVIDGKTNFVPKGFNIIQVPRVDGQFCWSNMWEAGVATSFFEKILYLDSDRLLPLDYLIKVNSNLEEKVFVFTSKHFMVTDPQMTKLECMELLSDYSNFSKYTGKLRFEPRFQQPFCGPGKNVMSGNTAFMKNTYYNLGGVDPWYCGHGAYADTDFHMKAGKSGCQFIDLKETELHCHHHKLDKTENPLTTDELYKMALDNFIYYVWKWRFPSILAENIAYECRIISKPREYVDAKLTEYEELFPRNLAE